MPTRDAKFTYTPRDYEHLLFAWEGGPYIDVFAGDAEYPGETINVWDYEKDVPTIDRTHDAFRAECDQWIKDQD